ncbi:hypothetical protein G6F43_010996 [Rhizopus delemar]|nr:hypothetical protein G6F43_010996 [Rhizopus delemar]
MNSFSSPPTSPPISTFTSHFVQALHDYLPSSAPVTDEPVTCLFFKKGSIIEVFNRDDSGWWDGQCGEIRGWFPSNYVGRIGEAKRSSLDFERENDDELTQWQQEKHQEKMSTRISFIEEVSEIIKELKKEYSKDTNTIQILVFQLVSCIKSILVESNIVNKESPILKVYPELAKQRKLVFSTLNKLVLKCKETDREQELTVLADQLLYDLHQFERILQLLPSSLSDLSFSSSRSSLTSIQSNSSTKYDPKNTSSSSLLLLSTFKLNTDTILQSIFDRQSYLQDLISTLLAQLPLFLAQRQQVDLLDITQKAIERVKSFLAVVEHVCSNIEDLDRLSCTIPSDPHLVSLVFAKESVYSAITNLVTAIRASTHPSGLTMNVLELEHLTECCQQVIKTTLDCTRSVKSCLQPNPSDPPPLSEEMPKSYHQLDMMTRKISTLKAIEQELLQPVNKTQRPRASSVNTQQHPKRPRGLSLTSLNHPTSESLLLLPDTWNQKQTPAATPFKWTEEVILNREGSIKYASIEALVEHLTFHEKSPDLLFVRAFFYNFRLFTHPQELLELLIQRFHLPPTDTDDWTNQVQIPVRLRVYNVIKTWLENYFMLDQDAVIHTRLLCFTQTDLTEAMPTPAERMLQLIHKTFTAKETPRKAPTVPEKPSQHHSSIFSNLSLFDDHTIYPSSLMSKSTRNMIKKALSQHNLGLVHLLDIEPVELARQITLLENGLFCQIEPFEIIGQGFKKKKSQAVHVKAMIQKSTQITSWISDSVLNEVDVKKRANLLKYWIKVGDACLHLNNYNTLMAIRSALDSTCIIRLKRTWDHVSSKYRAMWDPIYRATDSQRNFAEYRHRLKSAVAPCLPFLGVYLTDMTFIDDGNRDYCLSGNQKLIHMDKYIKTTRVLNEIHQFQIPYRLIEVDEIQQYLHRVLDSVEQDDQVFYSKSLKLEPKEED